MGCTASVQTEEYTHNSNNNNASESDPFLKNKKANDEIEKSMKLVKQQDTKDIKLLLLGAGESGKSTILKQLKLLHNGGFTHDERLKYSQVIWVDTIQSMKILIIQARKLDIKLQCDDNINNKELFDCKRILMKSSALDFIDTNIAGGTEFLNDYVVKYSERSETLRQHASTGQVKAFDEETTKKLEIFSPIVEDDDQFEEHTTETTKNHIRNISLGLEEEVGNDTMYIKKKPSVRNIGKKISKEEIALAIKKLWMEDIGIKRCFVRANEFQLEGSASYYFENVEKFSKNGYLCTDEDILMGRIKTTGITETDFNIGNSKFKVLDAGGQRSERKKWLHCFQGITAVCFVIALSEYDQMLFEDEKVNRMRESIMLFDTILNSEWFKDTPFILFLNKVDIFNEKVKKTPIRKYFPRYQGKMGDAEEGIKFFEKILMGLNRSKKPVYVKRTCATDTETMKFVLGAVTDLIIQQNLEKSGIL